MRIFIHCLAMIGISNFATNAAAHHSFAAEFSYELFGSREGEVVEVHFVNPHAQVFFAVKNEDGEEQIWNAQTFPPQKKHQKTLCHYVTLSSFSTVRRLAALANNFFI